MGARPNSALGLKAGDQGDQRDQGYLSWWVLATSVGLVLGGGIAATVEGAIRRSWYRFDMPESEEAFKAALTVGVTLAVWGASIGVMQWAVLGTRLHRAGWWVPATAAGWGLAGAVAGVLSAVVNDFNPSGSDSITVAKIALGFIPFFLMPGLVQWLGLRRRVHAAVWWLWGSVGALFLSGIGAFALVRGGMVSAGWLTPYDFPSVKVFVLVGVVMGPIFGAVTGVVMVRLLRQQRTTS
jgi:hypothetical protein